MRFIFDRNISPRLARMIDIFDVDNAIRQLDDEARISPTTPDIKWLKVLTDHGDPRWIVVSGDGRMLKNRTEVAALDEVRLKFLCMSESWMNMNINV